MKFNQLPIIRHYARYLGILVFVCLPLFDIGLFVSSLNLYELNDLLLLLLLCIVAVFSLLLFHFVLYEKLFSYLLIEENAIKWKCPLRKTVLILLEDCRVIGLEYEDAFAKNTYAYIYFVTFPYSQEISKYYGKVKCREGLIKFRYTNKLAKYVIDHCSDKVTYSLRKYYRDHKNDKLFY